MKYSEKIRKKFLSREKNRKLILKLNFRRNISGFNNDKNFSNYYLVNLK